MKVRSTKFIVSWERGDQWSSVSMHQWNLKHNEDFIQTTSFQLQYKLYLTYKSCDISTGCFVFQCPSSTIWFFHPVTSISDTVSASPHRLVCLHQQPACPSSPALESWSWQPVEASHALTCLPLNEEMSGNWGRQTRHSAGTVWHTVHLAAYIANSTDDCPREDDRRWGWLPSGRMDCLYKVDKVLSILIFSL